MAPVDPGKLLSYGAIGLGFLLAFLAYLLLILEQKRTEPRKTMIEAIYGFMGFALILSVLGFASEYLKLKNTPIQTQDQHSVTVTLREAHPGTTNIGDSAGSLREINNLLAGPVPAALQKNCFPKPPDHELFGVVESMVYQGSGGYAYNENLGENNFDKSTQECVTGVYRGTLFPEPTGADPKHALENTYWITSRVSVSPSSP